jgi:hypothetical protein
MLRLYTQPTDLDAGGKRRFEYSVISVAIIQRQQQLVKHLRRNLRILPAGLADANNILSAKGDKQLRNGGLQ